MWVIRSRTENKRSLRTDPARKTARSCSARPSASNPSVRIPRSHNLPMRLLLASLIAGAVSMGCSATIDYDENLAAYPADEFSIEPFGTRYQHVLPLSPGVRVFAYSRVSPDGDALAFALDDTTRFRFLRRPRTLHVVDLNSRETLLSEPGMDGYWSTDGTKLIYLNRSGESDVRIWSKDGGSEVTSVADRGLGDYFSWGSRDGRDMIMTIRGSYYFLGPDHRATEISEMQPCPELSENPRPFLSRDGQKATVFTDDGLIAVRNVDDCDDVLLTGTRGAKADFSWDGRYIAFHSPKADQSGRFQISVIDLEEETLIPVTNLEGSSFYPSWSKDGSLYFHYDSEEFRGFVAATGFLDNPSTQLTDRNDALDGTPDLGDLLDPAPSPSTPVVVLNMWATWCGHCRDELPILQELQDSYGREQIAVLLAADWNSRPEDISRVLSVNDIELSQVRLMPSSMAFVGGFNQIPASLVFVNGRLFGRRLGALSRIEWEAWVDSALSASRSASLLP